VLIVGRVERDEERELNSIHDLAETQSPVESAMSGSYSHYLVSAVECGLCVSLLAMHVRINISIPLKERILLD
jgi:hypothetical protein